MLQNLWDAVEVVLGGMFIAAQVYLRKQEKSQIKNLTIPKVSKKRINKAQS